VPPQVGEQRGDLRVAQPLEARGRLRRRAVAEGLPGGRRRQPEKGVVLEVLHRLEPAAEPGTAGLGEHALEPPAEAKRHDVPAEGVEEAPELLAPVIAHDAVQALAVQVDDDDVAGEVGHRLLGPGLPHAPLVQLGVADERDVPRALGRAWLAWIRHPRPPEPVVEVSVHQRREGGRHRTQAHRAHREVEPVGVLRSARVGLEATERPVRAKTLGRQEPPQDLDRVENRRRGGLDRDAIARPQDLEEERREKRERRRGARLVAAHALRRRIGSPAVRVVDRVGGEPEQSVLDAEEEPALLVVEPWPRGDGLHGPLSYPVGGIIAEQPRPEARRPSRKERSPCPMPRSPPPCPASAAA
jgi:hypothetical protein